MNKKIIIPIVIISLVTAAYFYTQQKNASNKKAWLKDHLSNSEGSPEAKQQAIQKLEAMSNSEIDVLFSVLNTYKQANNAPIALQTKFNDISLKYNIFS